MASTKIILAFAVIAIVIMGQFNAEAATVSLQNIANSSPVNSFLRAAKEAYVGVWNIILKILGQTPI